MREEGEIIIKEDVLFWAFRYALGRSTYAVSDVYEAIYANWRALSRDAQMQIKREITRASLDNNVGMSCDAKLWGSILRLEVHPL